jgi:hypothetical protein
MLEHGEGGKMILNHSCSPLTARRGTGKRERDGELSKFNCVTASSDRRERERGR